MKKRKPGRPKRILSKNQLEAIALNVDLQLLMRQKRKLDGSITRTCHKIATLRSRD